MKMLRLYPSWPGRGGWVSILVVALGCFASTHAQGATRFWFSGNSTNWDLAANWQNNAPPLASDSVVILPTIFQPVQNGLVNGIAGTNHRSIQNLTIGDTGIHPQAGISSLTVAAPSFFAVNGILTLAPQVGTTGIFNLGNGTGVTCDLKVGGTDGIRAGSGSYAFNWSALLVVIGSDLTTSINATLSGMPQFAQDSFNATWSGVLSGSGLLTVGGAVFGPLIPGTITLSGANTYSGGTTVEFGTLNIASPGTASGTGTGPVTVNASTTLSGSGNIGGACTVAGTLLPGSANTFGLLTFNAGLTQSNGSTLKLNLGGATRGTQYSAINVIGGLSLASGSTLNLSLSNGFAPSVGSVFHLFQVSSGSISGTFTNIVLPAMGNGLVWDTSSFYTTGDISVAEPANFAAWAGAVGLSGGNTAVSARPFTDGLPNLPRYAMSLDTSSQPGGVPQPVVVNSSGTLYLTLQYRVRKNMTDAQLTPQSSPDLVNWTDVDSGSITQLADDDAFTARYQARILLPANGQVFLRVVTATIP